MKRAEEQKRHRGWLLVIPVIVVAAGGYWILKDDQPGPQPAAVSTAQPSPSPLAATPEIPPFYEDLRTAGPLPKVLPAQRFQGHPVVERAYRTAAKIPEILAQEPCYCACDRVGHRSLLDCFASDHGAG